MSTGNAFVRFKQLIIDNTKLIPANIQNVFSMNIRFGYRCWIIATWFPWFLCLCAIVIDPFLISSNEKRTLLFKVKKEHFTCPKLTFSSVHMESNFHDFESFPKILTLIKLLVMLLPEYLQVLFAFGIYGPLIMLPIRSLRAFSGFRYVLWLRCQIHCSKTYETITSHLQIYSY